MDFYLVTMSRMLERGKIEADYVSIMRSKLN